MRALERAYKYHEAFATLTLRLIQCSRVAQKTRKPWAVRYLYQEKDRGRLRLLAMKLAVLEALKSLGAKGAIEELALSDDARVSELAYLADLIDYALGTYLKQSEYLIVGAYDAEAIAQDARVLALVSIYCDPLSSGIFQPTPPLDQHPPIQPSAPNCA
ncbi:MAG: hypothetical protein N3C58_01895 [Meiothermus ruber]|nr:hypothetical protein [Meiothermus ruber]